MSEAPNVQRVVDELRKYRRGMATDSATGSSMTEMWLLTVHAFAVQIAIDGNSIRTGRGWRIAFNGLVRTPLPDWRAATRCSRPSTWMLSHSVYIAALVTAATAKGRNGILAAMR